MIPSLLHYIVHRCLQSAVVFYALHCSIMDSAAAFWDVYHSIISTASSVEVRTNTQQSMKSHDQSRDVSRPATVLPYEPTRLSHDSHVTI